MKRVIACVLLAAAPAHAACPTSQAACLLHEEGTTALAARRYDDAIVKFRASIAATPTARAYLGYALALEATGRFALAYEAIVEAQQLSMQDVAANAEDVETSARAERIKYKLGELRTRVGLLRLQLPPGVSPELVVAIQRAGEGDLRAPLASSFAVRPGHQPLIVRLRDGRTFELVASVAAGSEASLVIPFPEATPVAPAPRSPLAAVIDAIVMPAGGDDGGSAFGGLVRGEFRASGRIALSARIGYLFHADVAKVYETTGLVLTQTAESSEVALLAGGSVTVHGPLYAFAELGILRYAYKTDVVDQLGMAVARDAKTLTYAALTAGAGVHWNRIDGRIGVVVPNALDDVPPDMRAFDLPVRIMVSLGVEVFPF